VSYPTVVDVNEDWWRSRTEEQREEYRQMLEGLGVTRALIYRTRRTEVEGDQVRLYYYHWRRGERQAHLDCNGGTLEVCVRTKVV
jgi:hypothetical protein